MDSNDGIHFTANDARKYTNDKGIVTRDRKVKKDVFYLYKSLWNHKITTVYITGRRMTQRASENPIDIKVYSNAQSLTLYQNGKAIQTMKGSGEETGIIWNFKPVKMQTNNDTFKVVANNGTSDQVTFKKI
jgi:beta-galactosidase